MLTLSALSIPAFPVSRRTTDDGGTPESVFENINLMAAGIGFEPPNSLLLRGVLEIISESNCNFLEGVLDWLREFEPVSFRQVLLNFNRPISLPLALLVLCTIWRSYVGQSERVPLRGIHCKRVPRSGE